MTLRAIRMGLSPHADVTAELSEFGKEMVCGLRGASKRVSSKFFYDHVGSLIFDQICELPEYYPTRAEIALLKKDAGEIADAIGADATAVEFGAGSSRKIALLLDALDHTHGLTSRWISPATILTKSRKN